MICCQRGPRGPAGPQGGSGGGSGSQGAQGAQGNQGVQGCGCPPPLGDPCDNCAPGGGGSVDQNFTSDFSGTITGVCALGTGGTLIDGSLWALNTGFDCATIQHDSASVIEFLTLTPDASTGVTGIIMVQQNPTPVNQLDPVGDGGLHAAQDWSLCARFSLRGDYSAESISTPSAQVGLAPAIADPLTDPFFGFSVHTTSPVYELMSRYTLVGTVVVTIPLPLWNDGLFHKLRVFRASSDPLVSNGDGTSTAQFSVQVDDGPTLVYVMIVQDTCMVPTIIADGGIVAGGNALVHVDLLMEDYCCQYSDACTEQ